MKVNKKVLNISFWVALLTVLFIPGNIPAEGVQRTEYGFPLRFFIHYYSESNANMWFLQGVRIELFIYLVDVAIIYGMLLGVKSIYNQVKKN